MIPISNSWYQEVIGLVGKDKVSQLIVWRVNLSLLFLLSFYRIYYNFPCNRCVPFQRGKIIWKEEILGPVLKLDSRFKRVFLLLLLINCIASATGSLMFRERTFYIIWNYCNYFKIWRTPLFFLFFYFDPTCHTTHSLFGWLESCRNFPFWYLDFVMVCLRIRPEIVEELGSFWVLTCLFVCQHKKLTEYHYFLFSVKQINIRMKLCLEFLMFVFKWQVSSMELKEKNYKIDLIL